MKTARLAALLGATVGFSAQQPADACGDKLSMMGGGVSFELVNPNRHLGKVVLFITPDSPLHAGNAELKKALERAGHTVRTVTSTADLKNALRAGSVDIVLTNLGAADDAPLPATFGPGAPPLLSVVYKPAASDISDSSLNRTCTVRVDKPRGRQLPKAVGDVIANKGVGLTSACVPVSESSST